MELSCPLKGDFPIFAFICIYMSHFMDKTTNFFDLGLEKFGVLSAKVNLVYFRRIC